MSQPQFLVCEVHTSDSKSPLKGRALVKDVSASKVLVSYPGWSNHWTDMERVLNVDMTNIIGVPGIEPGRVVQYVGHDKQFDILKGKPGIVLQCWYSEALGEYAVSVVFESKKMAENDSEFTSPIVFRASDITFAESFPVRWYNILLRHLPGKEATPRAYGKDYIAAFDPTNKESPDIHVEQVVRMRLEESTGEVVFDTPLHHFKTLEDGTKVFKNHLWEVKIPPTDGDRLGEIHPPLESYRMIFTDNSDFSEGPRPGSELFDGPEENPNACNPKIDSTKNLFEAYGMRKGDFVVVLKENNGHYLCKKGTEGTIISLWGEGKMPTIFYACIEQPVTGHRFTLPMRFLMSIEGEPNGPGLTEQIDRLARLSHSGDTGDDGFAIEPEGGDPAREWMQKSPAHYGEEGIQPVEYIRRNGLDFFEGNVVKYVTRHRFKDGEKDIRKAIHYLEMILEEVYNATEKESPVVTTVDEHPTVSMFQTEPSRLDRRMKDIPKTDG